MDVWVLIRAGAVLHAGPTEVLTNAAEPIPMLLVAQEPDRVVVTTPPNAPACYAMPYAGKLAVQLWVAPDDVLPVLTGVEERRFADGSGLRLDPGLAVEGGAVEVGGRRFEVQSVGTRYTADRHTRAVEADAPVLWAPTVASLGPAKLPLDPETPWQEPFTRVEVKGDRALLIEERPCAQLTWSAPWPPAGAEWPPPGYRSAGGVVGGILGGVVGPPGPPQSRIPAGTPVYWEDGSPAGETRAEVLVATERVTDAGACLDVGPRGAALRVCARREDILLVGGK